MPALDNLECVLVVSAFLFPIILMVHVSTTLKRT
jgi:hypothetical protein